MRVIDGDTVIVSRQLDNGKASPYHWRIRLLDCWAPERRTHEGKAAKEFAQDAVEAATVLAMWIPRPPDAQEFLSGVNLGRVLGHLFIGSNQTLSELMVRHGHATKAKPRLPP